MMDHCHSEDFLAAKNWGKLAFFSMKLGDDPRGGVVPIAPIAS